MSVPFQPPYPSYTRDRAFAFLLGLHGLALMVVFPFGPQAARLWRPGVPGVATLAAAFPLAAVLGGLLARRAPRLPSSPRALAALALLSTLPSALSAGYASLVAARLLAGLAAGLSYVAIHRAMSPAAEPRLGRIAPRVIAFGMPPCLLAATVLDWRAAFVPLLAGHLVVLLRAARRPAAYSSPPFLAPHPPIREAAPAALVATGALAFVSGAYLTVLSGFLVFNAGRTEWHIPACLLLGALLGLAVPPAFARLRAHLGPADVFAAALALSGLVLVALLALREPRPDLLCVLLVAAFLAANSARHLALSALVLPRLAPHELPAHQTHTHLAHHLGSGLGALTAGRLVMMTPAHAFSGMTTLLAAALAATLLAFGFGLAAAQVDASPAAWAAAANNRLRVAASLVRSVRASITRTPGSPT